jgi:hypothetical protein
MPRNKHLVTLMHYLPPPEAVEMAVFDDELHEPHKHVQGGLQLVSTVFGRILGCRRNSDPRVQFLPRGASLAREVQKFTLGRLLSRPEKTVLLSHEDKSCRAYRQLR